MLPLLRSANAHAARTHLSESPLPRYAIALLATALAVCIGLLLEPTLDDEGPWLTPALVFVIAVMLAARYGGKGPGLLAVALSGLADAFFFLPPFRSLQVASPRGLAQVALFALVGMLVTGVMEAMRAARTRAEASARAERESEERFRRLVASVREYALLLLDETGRVTGWNPGVERVLGWREDEIVGRPIACLFTPEDVARGVPEQELERAAREGRVSDDRWHLRQDGTRFFATGVMEAVRGQDGNLTGFSKVMRDETERRRLEHVRNGQTKALDRLVSALTARPELETLLGHVLATVAELMDARRVCLWLRDEEVNGVFRPHLALDTAFAETDEAAVSVVAAGTAAWAPLGGETDLWHEMARTRWPLVVEDVCGDARVHNGERLRAGGLQTLMLAPLLLGDEIVGALGIGGDRAPQRYLPEEVELAQALAQQAALAVQLARLAEQEQQNAVLHERNRMAREIHDTLAQGFTGIGLQLEAAEWEVSRAPDKALARLARARDLARQSLQEARRSVWALQPEALLHGDLPSVLRGHAEQMTHGTAVKAEVRTSGSVCLLPPEVETHLLRIGLEALTNALKHARASRVVIDLTYEPERVRLSVRDDGQGFDPEALVPSNGTNSGGGGFGLRAMRERAARIGAEWTISSQPGVGTEVAVIVPLPSPVSPEPAPTGEPT
jgi:PAS domain S-box-containing protein